jgi:hypothetical protein
VTTRRSALRGWGNRPLLPPAPCLRPPGLLLHLAGARLRGAGCTRDPHRVGDVIVARDKGGALGRVVAVGPPTFDPGVTDRPARVARPRQPKRRERHSGPALPGNFRVQGPP